MRHTLITPEDRLILHREYRLRAFAVLAMALASACVIGMIALLPAFLRATTAEHSALAQIAASKVGGKSSAASMQAELAADGALVSSLASLHGEPRLSDIVSQIAGARSGISVTSLSVSRSEPGAVSIGIAGVAPTRDALLAFKTRLESLAPGTTVDLPIDELAASANIEFTLTVAEKPSQSVQTP